jgi:aflatoxin B1 aldehyde reductase
MSRVGAAAMPRFYLGTMTFGWEKASTPVTEAIGTEMILRAAAAGITHVDSARIYASGATEPIVGSCLRNISPEIRRTLKVTSKAHPSQSLGLSPEGLHRQVQESLAALGVDYVDELYLHQPDTENDLHTTLEAAHNLVQRGLVRRLGMSNYHESEVERCLELCRINNWTPPSVYQGIYNPLNRRCEANLIPLLQKNNINFIAYNALAAGLLTGKHSPGADVQPGRFKENPNYLPRFYTDNNFAAVELIKRSLPDNIDIIAATYQWLLRHSALGADDGILIGASSLDQLDCNLRAI